MLIVNVAREARRPLAAGSDDEPVEISNRTSPTGVYSRRPATYIGSVPTTVHGDFEWDENKAASNAVKHGVTFDEAALAMKDPRSSDFEDLVEPAYLVTLAASPTGRILYIVSTESDDRIRIISAREATRHERRLYEEGE